MILALGRSRPLQASRSPAENLTQAWRSRSEYQRQCDRSGQPEEGPPCRRESFHVPHHGLADRFLVGRAHPPLLGIRRGRVRGGDPQSQWRLSDIVSLGFKKSPRHLALIQDAIFVIGGQSPMVTFRGNLKLQKLLAEFYESGKVTALVCHGTCLLLETKLDSGELLVKGKTWTGFANSEEKFAAAVVGKRIQPFWIEDEARTGLGYQLHRGPDVSGFRGARRAARHRAAAVLRRGRGAAGPRPRPPRLL